MYIFINIKNAYIGKCKTFNIIDKILQVSMLKKYSNIIVNNIVKHTTETDISTIFYFKKCIVLFV